MLHTTREAMENFFTPQLRNWTFICNCLSSLHAVVLLVTFPQLSIYDKVLENIRHNRLHVSSKLIGPGAPQISQWWAAGASLPRRPCRKKQNSFFFLKIFIYLFLERREGREKEMERNISVWLPLTHPHWGPGPQPRHVPWLGIELVILWFAGSHSIHWATPARVAESFLSE